ncbi:hypothetical protein C4D60_Mb08t08520 [Musa balbisiana]|uniref:Uncharacterized protein n=1 Tax=Musa balbisiana TaxID=52838 RepID=A0A4S8K2A8_MUSBA|nr:hypothetical protein C4D60_Mb08t08520 [Musa balbisiana]
MGAALMAIQQDDKLFNRWPFDSGEALGQGEARAPRFMSRRLASKRHRLGAGPSPGAALRQAPGAQASGASASAWAEHEEATHEAKEEGPSCSEQTLTYTSSPPGLRRRPIAKMETKGSSHDAKEKDSAMPVKLDASALAHIEKHRKLQEDLTDDLVALARQLKEGSLMINRSVQDTEKILDSTENAVEHSLASTSRASKPAIEILDSTENAVEHSLASTSRASKPAIEVYSESFKTTCFTWLVIFIMICVHYGGFAHPYNLTCLCSLCGSFRSLSFKYHNRCVTSSAL